MHCFQTRLKISIYQRKLFVFFPCQSTVRVSHRLPLVFFVVSELKHRVFLLLSLHAKGKLSFSLFWLLFDFSEQWFLFFPNLIKYKEKEILSVKMVSQHQSKDSGFKKNGGKELGMAAPQEKSSKKMKFASSSAETEPTSQTTISDDSKSGRGMSTMPRVVKRKLQKLRPIVEYNKREKVIGQAHSEMQSYIGVLARSRVPLVNMKWSQIPKDIKEQIWEAVDMAFMKWKDFKSTLTRHYILPYTNDREKLSQPPETYKFIEKAQWDAFVASRLSKDFESVHSQHAQIREKLEYNH
ncbi:hypothetical protein L3X38_016363 [Prunus dulcis]|uniref:Non-ATPase subunit 9 n=1 Tax=Prunus dulcis TaxID=3755 RepID=A0AAD4W574_PRUDU|nr:hypothetical protein L3X38_016363 [Prunus dulcis]